MSEKAEYGEMAIICDPVAARRGELVVLCQMTMVEKECRDAWAMADPESAIRTAPFESLRTAPFESLRTARHE